MKMAQIAAFKVKPFQPVELLSTASDRLGAMIEYRLDSEKSTPLAELQDMTAKGVEIKGQLKGG